MGATYEIFITRADGSKIAFFEDLFFFTYARIVNGVSYIQIAFPLALVQDIMKTNDVFQHDWRLEMWRSPAPGFTQRLERTFFLRKRRVYTRESDGIQILEYTGQGPNSLLGRRIVPTRSGSSFAEKQGNIDDIMKEIVRENLGASAVDENGVLDPDRNLETTGFFSISADVSIGPYVGKAFSGSNVLEILKEFSALSEAKHFKNQANRRIFFEVADPEVGIFTFRTIADQFGADLSSSKLEFSPDNENLKEPLLEEDFFDARNVAYVAGQGEGASRIIVPVIDAAREKSSIWNRTEIWRDARSTPSNLLQSVGEEELRLARPELKFSGTFLNIPGGPNTPRSLYGIDWDLGDIVKINYADEQFNAEIRVIYVSVNQEGEESVTGRQTPN